jgi:hypothetical protein
MTTMQLCEAWLIGEPCFAKLMGVALEEIYGLEWEMEHEFHCGAAVPARWAEGWSVPHPILQSRVVDFLMEVSQR